MQTFLPYPDFRKSVQCLDYKRLSRQRPEALQILRTLEKMKIEMPKGKIAGWTKHPAVLMWQGYEDALKWYYNEAVSEWVARGFNNTMELIPVDITKVQLPPWIGDEKFHASHRSNLLRKDEIYYSDFDWEESIFLPYVWPSHAQQT